MRPLIRDLPIGAVFKTYNGYVWKKLDDTNRFICIDHVGDGCRKGDIYVAGSNERLEEGDKVYNFQTYYKLCKKQAKS